MTEGMEAIPAGHNDTKRPEQGAKFPFEQQILIPRRSVASAEDKPIRIRTPRFQERPQMRAALR
jgi:hypothetical protein